MSHRRTCHDCLKAFRRKNRGARKPWPEWVFHFTGGRHCAKHAALRSEQSTRQSVKRAPRAVAWADRKEIRAVYAEAARRRMAGERVHVDHVIPMLGVHVSGLHVAANLQVIPATENIKKGNRYIVS